MIRKAASIIALFCAAGVFATPGVRAEDAPLEPVRLIFDTDMGNDIDDALALACIHALQSRGECELLAVTVTKDNPYAAAFIDAVNTFYGRPDIPIGVVRDGKTPEAGNYIQAVATATDDGQLRYPHDLTSGEDAPVATDLLRRILAAQPDNSVAIVQVGFSTNLARLLESGPDKHSPLNGRELVMKKVQFLSAMAGTFGGRRFPEYNVVTDVDSAQRVFHDWPRPVVFSGFEIGDVIRYPAVSIEEDYDYVPHHPVAEGYGHYMKMPYDRQTWDLTSVLYAVRPDRGYFGISPEGKVSVSDKGMTTFEESARGGRRYLTVNDEQIVRVREALVMLASQPPDARINEK